MENAKTTVKVINISTMKTSKTIFTEKSYQPKLFILEFESPKQMYTNSCNKR